MTDIFLKKTYFQWTKNNIYCCNSDLYVDKYICIENPRNVNKQMSYVSSLEKLLANNKNKICENVNPCSYIPSEAVIGLKWIFFWWAKV